MAGALDGGGPLALQDQGRDFVGLEGLVFVDKDYGESKWAVTHALTCEVKFMDWPFNEEAFIEWEDGVGVATSDAAGTEPLLLHELFEERLYRDHEGAYCLESMDSAGRWHDRGSLEHLSVAHSIGSLTFPLGANRVQVQFDFACFERPRFGHRCYWSMLHLLKMTNFEFEVQYGSTWVHTKLGAWQKALAQMSLGGSLDAEQDLQRLRYSR
jgi:hypothetical protein